MTNLEAMVKLYNALMYCQDRAYRQRSDEHRVAYNAAFSLIRTALEAMNKDYRHVR